MATPAQMELHRHYHQLSEKDADAVVQTMADLIVSYLSQNPESFHHVAATPPEDTQVKEVQA